VYDLLNVNVISENKNKEDAHHWVFKHGSVKVVPGCQEFESYFLVAQLVTNALWPLSLASGAGKFKQRLLQN